MQRNWRRAVFALLICLLFVFAVACSNGATTTTTSAGTTSTTTKGTTTESQSGTTQTGSDELEFVTFDWYLGLSPMPDNQMVNDAVNEYLKEKINANVKIYYWTGAEWEEKMTTMVSAGQDVGIIGFGSQSKLDYVVQSNRGAFYPLDDLLGQYGSGTWKLFDEAIWNSMRINGKIYGIPSLKDNCYIISIIYNAEMADALGIDMESVDYKNWRNIEPFLNDVIEKRETMFPEYDQYPLCGGAGLESPYNFAIESFLNDSYLAACNIDPFFDVEGFDADTVFNLYATDEYREFCKSRQRMVERNIFAYDYTDKSEWNYTGGMFAWVGWGYTYMQEHLFGDNFTTKMVVSDHIWTDTNNYFSAGTAISANCAVPERAMMLLELVNTDPEFATMMRFGIEGKHYIINNEGKMQFEGSERNGGERADYGYYYWYAAPVGNLTIVKAPESLTGPNGIMLDRIIEYNNSAVLPNHMGFVFNVEPVANEIAACTNVVMEYRDTLRNGQLDSQEEVDTVVDEFVAKLEANNVQKIVDECQKQINEWKAGR
ncbi:MAG: ABC transporter substrate-binding protein [Eubacteriales bacterium]|nr:ABC transporter substrate-binding protein [Eubacteriales bacterium]MDD4744072.1 ABC transporter substrate-binding protein [Eubacteriales bacterium]